MTVSVSSTEGIGIGSGFFGRFSWGRLHDFVKDDTNALLRLILMVSQESNSVIIRTRDLKESFT